MVGVDGIVHLDEVVGIGAAVGGFDDAIDQVPRAGLRSSGQGGVCIDLVLEEGLAGAEVHLVKCRRIGYLIEYHQEDRLGGHGGIVGGIIGQGGGDGGIHVAGSDGGCHRHFERGGADLVVVEALRHRFVQEGLPAADQGIDLLVRFLAGTGDLAEAGLLGGVWNEAVVDLLVNGLRAFQQEFVHRIGHADLLVLPRALDVLLVHGLVDHGRDRRLPDLLIRLVDRLDLLPSLAHIGILIFLHDVHAKACGSPVGGIQVQLIDPRCIEVVLQAGHHAVPAAIDVGGHHRVIAETCPGKGMVGQGIRRNYLVFIVQGQIQQLPHLIPVGSVPCPIWPSIRRIRGRLQSPFQAQGYRIGHPIQAHAGRINVHVPFPQLRRSHQGLQLPRQGFKIAK